MTTFKPNDRVKVVRESETRTIISASLIHKIGSSGVVKCVDKHFDDVFVVILGNDAQYFIPADMLELEVFRG